jgi:DNA-binding CsgD family transcriptional regulator
MHLVTLNDGPGRTTPRQLAVLTRRERQVLRLVSYGRLNKEIAYALGISISTVKSHVARLIAAGGFSNRVQVARWALLHPEAFAPGCAVEVDTRSNTSSAI